MENFQTYGNVGSSSVNANQFSGVSTSLSRSFRSTRSASNSVISVRTSDQSYHSVGGGNQSSYLTPTGTGSFISMHGDVSVAVMQKIDFTPVTYAESEGGESTGRPNGGATGELNPEFASPVGDVLLPMLLMVGVYAVMRWFKNWKKKLTGKRLFCIK